MEAIDLILDESRSTFDEFERQASELRLNLSVVESTIAGINQYGICKADVIRLAEADVVITNRDYPVETFTARPSTVNLVYAGESIGGAIGKGITKLFTLIYKAIAGVCRGICRFFKWIWEKLFGRKVVTKELTEAVKAADGTNGPELLSRLDPKVQSTVLSESVDLAVIIQRYKEFTNEQDTKLFAALQAHVEVMTKANEGLNDAVKDTTGTKASVIEADVAKSAMTLLAAIHTSEDIKMPDLALKGALLGDTSEAIGKFQSAVSADIDKVKKIDKAKDKVSGESITNSITVIHEVLKELKEFEGKSDVKAMAASLDKLANQADEFAGRAEKLLSKEELGVFFKTKTSAQLKLTQVTIQRANQIVLLAVQRFAYALSLKEQIATSKFAKSLPIYMETFEKNKKDGKRNQIIDFDSVNKAPSKKKD